MKTGTFSRKILYSVLTTSLTWHRYKIGDTFVALPVPEAQQRLNDSVDRAEQTHQKLVAILHRIRTEMDKLKVMLYAKFGASINLET